MTTIQCITLICAIATIVATIVIAGIQIWQNVRLDKYLKEQNELYNKRRK